MTTQRKISKGYTLLENDGTAVALYSHRMHHIFFKEFHDFSTVDTGYLPWNSASEMSIDSFYDKLEKYENHVCK